MYGRLSLYFSFVLLVHVHVLFIHFISIKVSELRIRYNLY